MVAKPEDITHLPEWPRLMRVEIAASYCGMSASLFKDIFADLKPAIRRGKIKFYDREVLDEAISHLQQKSPVKNDQTIMEEFLGAPQ